MSEKPILQSFALVILLSFAVAYCPANEQKTGNVVKVTDGDTITILSEKNIQTKIRLYGIDAPERGQDYGNAAREALASLVAGKNAKVEIVGRDRWRRVIGIVWVEDTNINLHLVEKGWAWWFEKYAPNDTALAAAHATAKSNGWGLWRDRNPMAPWDYRASKKAAKKSQGK